MHKEARPKDMSGSGSLRRSMIARNSFAARFRFFLLVPMPSAAMSLTETAG